MSDQPAISPNNWFANVIGAVVVTFLCWATGYLLVRVVGGNTDLSEQVSNIVYIILGFLTAKLSTVVDWSFGTSSATKRQGDIIATQASTIAAAQDKLPPVPGAPDKTVPLAAGETVQVKADEPK
jgi:hypothetical protein